jgi:Dna[CI] antecedent, DciA
MKGLEPVGAGLDRELRRLGPPGGISTVVAAWPEAVGPAIVANAWPARLARDGTLHVFTSSSAWAFELTQLEETVRTQLRSRLGDACPPRLRFASGPLPEPGRDSVTTSEQALPRPSPATAATAEAIAAHIADPGLREAVARAAAASLAAAEPRSDDRSF